jgi:hypothetical protein
VIAVATNDRQRQFDQIVAGLTADYPSLAGRRRWSRRRRIAVGVLGGLIWGLLSVAMVAWGTAGVVLTCAIVVAAGAALVVGEVQWRRR